MESGIFSQGDMYSMLGLIKTKKQSQDRYISKSRSVKRLGNGNQSIENKSHKLRKRTMVEKQTRSKARRE